MNFLGKLDALMAAEGLNKHTLSMKCGIPYTTIDAWYKKGYNNAKLSTIQKLADFFDTSLDYLMRDEITNVDYGATKNSPEPAATDSEAKEEEIYQMLKKLVSDLHIDLDALTDRQRFALETISNIIADNF